ncbi:MAG: hypothetical protein ACYDA3_06040 [Gaiellaceae bacterium]
MEDIPVQAARIPDRDRLLHELLEAGLDARPIGEIEIMVTTDDPNGERDVLALVEHRIMSVGAPFVPMKHDGVIYVRPPVS